MKDLISLVFSYSDKIVDNRTSYGVLSSLVSEVGELATEVSIQQHHINRSAGVDGIIGESIDVILCALDIIRINYPDVAKEELINVLLDIAEKKCDKWYDQASYIPIKCPDWEIVDEG